MKVYTVIHEIKNSDKTIETKYVKSEFNYCPYCGTKDAVFRDMYKEYEGNMFYCIACSSSFLAHALSAADAKDVDRFDTTIFSQLKEQVNGS